jgi:SAM-dependent methyltransferase
MFAKMGYEVEGSDASAIAIKYAPQLAKKHGLNIRFFRSHFEDLSKKCRRRYDCIFSDYFDELETCEMLKKSAKGIYSVLKKDGKFIFCSVPPELTKLELNELIKREWNKRKRFGIDPPVEHNSLKVTHIEVVDKTQEGILENHIYLIEEKGKTRAEIAHIMNPRIKWTYQDYVKVLKEANFTKIEYIKREEGEILIIATK